MPRLVSQTPEDTKTIGKALARALRAGDSIGLIGELGAGKTQLVKGLALGIGIDEDEVTSPSFGLINEYAGDKKLYHVDLYRLDTIEDIETLGLMDYLGGDGICVIEWADRLGEGLSLTDTVVRIEILPDGRRMLEFAGENLTAFEGALNSLKEMAWR